jgi:hypothetical protein
MLKHHVVARLPDWARLSHPVTHYILRRAEYYARKRWIRILNCAVGVIFLAGILTFSIMLYVRGEYDAAFLPGESPAFVILYPLLAFFHFALSLGAVTQVMILGLNIPGASLDDQRATWEVTKISTRGADLVTRGRWAVALYRMSAVLVLLIGARIVFAGWLIIEFVREPDRLQTVLDQLTPAVPTPVGVLLVAVLLLAVTILPLTWAMLLISLGLFISTWVRRLWLLQLVQQVIVLGGITLYAFSLFMGWYALITPEKWISDPQGRVIGVWIMALFGDQGLRLMTRPALLQLLARVEYGIFVGLLLLVAVFTQVYCSRTLLRRSVRRAGRATRK